MSTRPRSKSTRSVSRAQSRTGPKAWTRVHGTVYGIKWETEGRTLLLRRPRTRIEYVGMYSGDWKERIRQHLYGGGPHHCPPKPWRFLVPGFDANARTLKEQRAVVERIIARGGAVVLWQKRTFHWVVKFHESLAITKHRPAANIQENLDNPRHIPKWEQEEFVAAAVAKRDRAAQGWKDSVAVGFRSLPDGSVKWFGTMAEVSRADEGFQVRCRDGREWEVF